MIALILMILATLAMLVFAGFLFVHGERIHSTGPAFAGAAFVILAAVMGAFAWNWHSAKYTASIINSEYGTKFTQEDVFFTPGVIGAILSDRKMVAPDMDCEACK